jgi:Ca2+:H+ antiporter
MAKIRQISIKDPLFILLLAFPLAIAAELAHWGQLWVFAISAVGVIPMAGYIGRSTEALATRTGPKIGGLLNATLGNAAELIIALVAVKAGLLELVKASLTGSILGNLLLVMGMALLTGGLKNGLQTFNRRQAGNHAVLLTLSILAMIVPSLFSHSIGPVNSFEVEELSLGVAFVMIVLYIIGLIYSLRVSPDAISYPADPETSANPAYSLRTAVIVLALSTAGVVVLSELLVGAVESVVENLGLSEFFLGIILIPIVGNVAEHLVAVQAAHRNHMNLSIEISISSSLQIALFVAPALVFISLAMGNPLTLIFNPFELIAMGSAVLIAVLVSTDGESNWLEGAALLAVYAIFGLAFFLLPA